MVKSSILDRNLNKTKNTQVSLSALAYLLSESLQSQVKNATGISQLESQLSSMGYSLGDPLLELVVWRDRNSKRETRLLPTLYMLHNTLWKALFDKPADSLEKGTDAEDEYMISDNDPPLSRWISVPRDMSTLNTNSWLAGLLEGVLDGCGMSAVVSAHSTATADYPNRTTFLLKFSKDVLLRERMLEGK